MNQSTPAIIAADNLHKRFKVTAHGTKGATLVALDGVSLQLHSGETLGIAGESGCGKSTLGKILAGLMKPDQGVVLFDGTPLESLPPDRYHQFRRTTQMVFQDPFSSLNPRMRIGDIIAEPLVLAGIAPAEVRQRTERLLETVGLPATAGQRFPDEFSGGQRQRIGIARSLSLKPDFIICDEPISALDVSIQAQVINLLEELQEGLGGLTYIFIAHDLSVVKHISDRIAVMYLGRIVEITRPKELYENPLHPYTRALLSAVPVPDPYLEEKRERIILQGEVPSPIHPPSGCSFHQRCFMAIPECSQVIPPLRDMGNGHEVACIRV